MVKFATWNYELHINYRVGTLYSQQECVVFVLLIRAQNNHLKLFAFPIARPNSRFWANTSNIKDNTTLSTVYSYTEVKKHRYCNIPKIYFWFILLSSTSFHLKFYIVYSKSYLYEIILIKIASLIKFIGNILGCNNQNIN